MSVLSPLSPHTSHRRPTRPQQFHAFVFTAPAPGKTLRHYPNLQLHNYLIHLPLSLLDVDAGPALALIHFTLYSLFF